MDRRRRRRRRRFPPPPLLLLWKINENGSKIEGIDWIFARLNKFPLKKKYEINT